jgi:DNA-binding winged helix-turn-helix (wHTH) protein
LAVNELSYYVLKCGQSTFGQLQSFSPDAAMSGDHPGQARFGAFRFDAQTGELRRKNRRMRIPPQPAQLLALLLRRAGQVVSAAEIREALWPDGREFGDFDHAIGIAVKKLRDALGDDPDHPTYIETLRRRGYRFIAPVTYDLPDARSADVPLESRFVGRVAELAELQRLLGLVARQERRIVFVTGQAGIGKTALVDEFLRRAAANGTAINVAHGQCFEGYGGKEPYFPMLAALGQLCRSANGTHVTNALTELAPMWLVQLPALVKGAQRERLLREAAMSTRERMLREMEELLQAISVSGPLVIVLEDLHWADHATLDLIAALGRHRAPARVLLICTYRPLDVALADHSLKTVKHELLIRGLASEIALRPWSETEVAEYLAAASPAAELPEGLVETIYRHAEGNPLFIKATLEHLSTLGVIAREGGGWQIRRPIEGSALLVPESLRELIEMQISRLPENERVILEIASVAGVAFSSEVCIIDGETAGRVEQTLGDLSRQVQLLRQTAPITYPDGTVCNSYEFGHALYREVFYQRLTPARRAVLHQQVGQRLEELYAGDPGEVATALARHFEQGFDWERAIRYLRLASRRAIERHAHREAAQLLEHALELVRRLPDGDDSAVEMELLEKLTEIDLASTGTRAVAAYERLRERAAQRGLLDVQVRALTRMAVPLSMVSAVSGLEVVQRALDLSDRLHDQLLRAATRASCFSSRMWIDRWNLSDDEQFRRSLAVIRSSGNEQLYASALIEQSMVELMASRYRTAHSAAVKGLAGLGVHEPDRFLNFTVWKGRVSVIWSLIFLGQWSEALEEIDSAVAEARKHGSPQREHSYLVLRALVHLLAFDFDACLGICQSAIGHVEHEFPVVARLAAVLAGAAQAGLGNTEGALTQLIGVREDMERRPIMRDAYWRLFLEWALTDMRLATADVEEARAQAERFLEATRATPDRTWQSLAWEASARVAIREGDVARAHDDVNQAIAAAAGYELPLASWRVLSTAASLAERDGEREVALLHRDHCTTTILRLANALWPHESLQQAFLSAPPIQEALQTGAVD